MKQPKVIQMTADREGLVKAVLYDDGTIFTLSYVPGSVSTTGIPGGTWQWNELPTPIKKPTPARTVEQRRKS